MPTTRLSIDRTIFDQFAPKLAVVGITPQMGSGLISSPIPTPGLGRPIGLTILELGGSVANFPDVTDADLATAPAAGTKFHDVLELRVLELILSRWDQANQTAGPNNTQDLGDLYDSILTQADAKRTDLKSRYSEGVAPLRRGRFRVGPGGCP